jgi:hypothetical protein
VSDGRRVHFDIRCSVDPCDGQDLSFWLKDVLMALESYSIEAIEASESIEFKVFGAGRNE